MSPRNQATQSVRLWLSALVLAALLGTGCGSDSGDRMAALNIPVTEGAAAGYVPDASCARCHIDLYRSFQEVGMAQSFYRPSEERRVEDFEDGTFYHEASNRHYRMRWEEGGIVFERYQLTKNGEPIHRFETEVDWILGSGHTSRTYLFRTPSGELYQLPIAWYSQTESWGMAPGFDNPDHLGVRRRVKQECMFCHNAYPEVPVGSDAFGQPPTFPVSLPEGIGCQRCHGPGAEHVRAALDGEEELSLSTIVNPGKLSPERAQQVCYGCHQQPTVSLAGVRRFGRTIYSHRPGEPLTDYMVPLDVDEEDQSRADRFEINHHPYRLDQSRCVLESEPGALGCTHCHDPHRKVAPERRKAHYRDACFACHQIDSCALEEMAASGNRQFEGRTVEADDCVACHMPRRRTQDVIQVVMTDHKIQREPGGPELLAPREERTPILVDAELLEPAPDLPPWLAEVYKAAAVIQAGGNPEAAEFLRQTLEQGRPDHPDPELTLVRGLLTEGRFQDAEQAATRLLERWPETPQALDWRAICRVRLGDPEAALADLDRSLEIGGERPEPVFNRGLVLAQMGRWEEAAEVFRRANALRPNMTRSRSYLGRVLIRLGQPEAAEEAFREALAVDPADSRATAELGLLLAELGRRSEAFELLEHGMRNTRNPQQIVPALEELGFLAPPSAESGP